MMIKIGKYERREWNGKNDESVIYIKQCVGSFYLYFQNNWKGRQGTMLAVHQK